MANLEDMTIGEDVNSLVLALSNCPAGDNIRENTIRIGLALGLRNSDLKRMKQNEEATEIWHDLLSAWVLKEGNNATVIQLYTEFLELNLRSFADILQFKYPNIINAFLKDLENKFSDPNPFHDPDVGGNVPLRWQQKPQNSNGSRYQRTRSSISDYLRRRPFLWIAGTMVLVIMVIVILVISVPGGSNV